MKRKAFSGIAVTLLFIGMLTLVFDTQTARSVSETKVYVDPATFGAGPGENFDIAINVENAENVFSWQFSLSWDPTILELQEVQEGNFLNQGIYPTFFQDYVDNDGGNITVVCILLGQPRSSSASGDGTLATVTFYVEDEGYTSLHLYNTMLLDYDILELPHGTEDGYFSTAFPTVVFSYLPEEPSIGYPVTFNASDSYDYDGFIVSYTWDFGDGNTTVVSTPVIVHVYVVRGTYLVNLTITDNDGNRSSSGKYVIVSGMQNSYIRADGSIDPPTAPISTVDNITYTLTGNISSEVHGVVVERNDVVIDGRGYTLQGIGIGNGFSIKNINNVTIKNTNVKGFYYGVCLNSTSRIVLSGNNITNNDREGIKLYDSSNNTISGNNIINNWDGIELTYSLNNTVYGNNIVNNYRGIDLSDSPNNSICGNNIIASENEGIYLWYSDNSNIFGNNIAFNYMGIYLVSSNNNVSGNSIAWNVNGLWVFEVNNSISGNAINGNYHSLAVWDGMQTHSIDVLNLIDGKPVYYLINQKDLGISPITYPQVGYLALINCANITVEDLTLTSNGQGLLLANTNNSKITHNHITNNLDGIRLDFSSNNTLSENNITNNFFGVNLFYSPSNTILRNKITNEYDGINLQSSSNNTISGNNVTNNYRGVYLHSSSNNRFYHNNFINNSKQIYIVYWHPPELPPPSPSINTWDDGYPSGGNYWSEYGGVDLYRGPYQNETGSDRIGDTPYGIDENNRDNYPLMNPWTGVFLLSDLDEDGFVGISDISVAAIAFGSFPGHPRWNPIADLNKDGWVDISDIAKIAVNFGKTV